MLPQVPTHDHSTSFRPPFCLRCNAEKRFVGPGYNQLYSDFMGYNSDADQWLEDFPINVKHDEDEFVWLVCSPDCPESGYLCPDNATDAQQGNLVQLPAAGQSALEEAA